MDEKVIARFWAKVDKTGDCWVWTACRTTAGYGQLGVSGRPLQYAHRISWELHYPQQPIGKLWVLHRCDNPPCVNPEHLFLGTIQDNVKDCYEKGRCGGGAPQGSRHGHSKLTELDIPEIRLLFSRGWSKKDIACGYEVSSNNIRAILSGKTWGHVK